MRKGYVVWYDTHSKDEWQELPTYSAVEITSIGFILESEEGVCVIANYAEGQTDMDEMCFGVTKIPRGCVKEINYFLA